MTKTSVHTQPLAKYGKLKKVKRSLKARYNCLTSFPLFAHQTGDIVILDKEDGEWYIGRNQRTGKTGMFPSSYAEKKN